MSSFEDNIAHIEQELDIHDSGAYKLAPVVFGFRDGHWNEAGQSLGSLKIFLYADKKELTVGQTLALFGQYLDEVNETPSGTSHPNIRSLMKLDRNAYVGQFLFFAGEPIVEKIDIESTVDNAWNNRTNYSPNNVPTDVLQAVNQVIAELDSGRLRVATREAVGQWTVHQWVKKAVLLSFRLKDNHVIRSGDLSFFDKVETKFARVSDKAMRANGIRVVPPAVARRGSYIAPGAILMPSYVNIGAYVDSGTMVDTWATVGSCAQIGKNVHLSGGVGIGGVLEPLQANPTIIEDNCFIGARSEVVEGVIVEENSVLGMGVYIGQSTPIFDRATGEISYGRVPSGSVVVSGNLPKKATNGADYSMYAAIIVKRVDAETRSKTSINDLLRP